MVNPFVPSVLLAGSAAFLLIQLFNVVSSNVLLESVKEKEVLVRNKRSFKCPGKGKWPDETDCAKYWLCDDSSSVINGWCGPSMSFDTDNQRCEMALAINCKDGERPDWKAPENWEGKTKEPTTVTTTTKKSNKPSEPDLAVGPTKPTNFKEGDRCNFPKLVADKENCQSYFYCKDNEVKRENCPDNQLFDEETKFCKDYKNAFCGDRPVNDKGKDPCRSKPNGVYPNFENGCVDFYQCTSQMKVKSGECPQGLKFNVNTLRCDFPNNVPVPCGTKYNASGASTLTLNAFLLAAFNGIFFAIFNK